MELFVNLFIVTLFMNIFLNYLFVCILTNRVNVVSVSPKLSSPQLLFHFWMTVINFCYAAYGYVRSQYKCHTKYKQPPRSELLGILSIKKES